MKKALLSIIGCLVSFAVIADYTPVKKEDVTTSTADGLQIQTVAKATYNFAVDGGAIGAIDLDVDIPANAVITDGYIDVTTALAGTGVASTVAISVEGANDIYSASTNLVDGGVAIYATVPVGTAATVVKTSAAKAVTLTIATEALTNGVCTIVLKYDLLAK